MVSSSEYEAFVLDTNFSIDMIWISSSAYLVWFMQLGFGFLEAGCTRFKMAQNELFKSMLDLMVGTFCWYLWGHGIAFGEDYTKFIGESLYANVNYASTPNSYRNWLYQWAFACSSATIISGTVAERIRLPAYLICSMCVTGWIYPTVVHWVWGNGWLMQWGFIDFAGSGVVHLCGASVALAVAIVVGPRYYRFAPRKKKNQEAPKELPPDPLDHCVGANGAWVVLGTCILWIGWYGFNCGSTGGAVGPLATQISLVGMNTSIAGSFAGLTSSMTFYIIQYIKKDRTRLFDLGAICNGALAGLVAVTAACGNIHPWAALIIGSVEGVFFQFTMKILPLLRIDDSVDAFAIHGFGGMLALIFGVGFFNRDDGIFYTGKGTLFGKQIVGTLVIFGWSFFWGLCFSAALKLTKKLRYSREQEKLGDLHHFGGYVDGVFGKLAELPFLKEKLYANELPLGQLSDDETKVFKSHETGNEKKVHVDDADGGHHHHGLKMESQQCSHQKLLNKDSKMSKLLQLL